MDWLYATDLCGSLDPTGRTIVMGSLLVSQKVSHRFHDICLNHKSTYLTAFNLYGLELTTWSAYIIQLNPLKSWEPSQLQAL